MYLLRGIESNADVLVVSQRRKYNRHQPNRMDYIWLVFNQTTQKGLYLINTLNNYFSDLYFS